MNTKIKKSVGTLLLLLMIVPPDITRASTTSNKVVSPLKEVAKLECRFQKFSDLDSSCKETLDLLNPDDYQKYATLNGGYNDYTRRYSVLWGSSYTYGWDVGNGGHMGVDIATAEGTPVYSTADGVVIIATNKGDYGNLVSIKHVINGKTIVSDYEHLSEIDVKVGNTVSAGDKIGEVGATGNATGNHLHFQIDIATDSSPAYYNSTTCPYSYYDIVNNGRCFDELQQLTVDPLEFLATGGDDLNNITIKQVKVTVATSASTSTSTSSSTTSSSNSTSSSSIKGVFDYTVYTDSSTQDIKYVETIFKALGYYYGKIDGNYSSVMSAITNYQLDKNIISSSSDTGAGCFGPKTRAQAKIDYNAYLAEYKYNTTTTSTSSTSDTTASTGTTTETETVVTNTQTVEKISRTGMLTREEIEAKEIEEFEQKYNIKIEMNTAGSSVSVGGTRTINVSITDKNGNAFKGNTPYPISFIVDNSLVSVFPTKFYNFTNGKRTVTLTGQTAGNTTLYVQLGSENIATFNLMVYNSGQEITPKSAVALAKSSVVLGDSNVGAILLKDGNGTNLLNLEYGGKLELKTEGNAEICVKTGNIKNAKTILKQECADSDYVKTKTITYDQTVGGLIIFNYKVFDKTATLKLYSYDQKKDFITLGLKTTAPKGLSESYAYYDEVMEMLEENIATTGIKQGYFLENTNLTQNEAITWIKNTLYSMKEDTADKNVLAIINSNLEVLDKEDQSTTKTMTRQEFLEKAYKYLVFNKSTQVTITYKDLSTEDNIKANAIFDKDNTWKDKFGDNYYQPDETITRGEGAYLLSRAYDRTKNLTLTVNK